MTADAVLKGVYPADVVDALLTAYREIEQSYSLGKWKASELDAGHFVEASRRMLEYTLLGASTPLDRDLPKFNDVALNRYANATGDESLRILIPRILWSIYGIRNKRGVGHIGPISPNEMDSALILANVKWVLAEFVRFSSGLTPAETQSLIDEITQRELELLWSHGDTKRVLQPKMPARQQVLLLLYNESPQKAADLQSTIEYASSSRFKTILNQLHTNRLIEFTADGTCIITPLGIAEAEIIAKNWKLLA